MKALVASGSLICPVVAWTHNITDIHIYIKKLHVRNIKHVYDWCLNYDPGGQCRIQRSKLNLKNIISSPQKSVLCTPKRESEKK